MKLIINILFWLVIPIYLVAAGFTGYYLVQALKWSGANFMTGKDITGCYILALLIWFGIYYLTVIGLSRLQDAIKYRNWKKKANARTTTV